MRILIKYSPNVIRLKGDKERDANTVTVRLHGTTENITLDKDEFLSKIKEIIQNKNIKYDL